MTHEQILEYCLKKKGTYLDYPFDPDYPVVRVKSATQEKGRIFAQIFYLNGLPKVTLNCTPASGEFYRSIYPGSVVRGWHCPTVQQPYFDTVSLDGSVPDSEIYTMMDSSYDIVISKYPKYIQKLIVEENIS